MHATALVLLLAAEPSPATDCTACTLTDAPAAAAVTTGNPVSARLAAIDAELAELPTSWGWGSILGVSGLSVLGVITAASSVLIAIGTVAAFAYLTSFTGMAGAIGFFVASFVGLAGVAICVGLAVLSIMCWGGVIGVAASARQEVEHAERRRQVLLDERAALERYPERLRELPPVPLPPSTPPATPEPAFTVPL